MGIPPNSKKKLKQCQHQDLLWAAEKWSKGGHKDGKGSRGEAIQGVSETTCLVQPGGN